MHSSRLVDLLGRSGISPEAARKQLQRAKPPVRRFPNLRLPGGSRFWYLDHQLESEDFWLGLLTALRQTGSAYGVALDALAGHGGLIPESQFPIICGSPSEKPRHLSVASVRDALESLGFIAAVEDPVLGTCLRLTENFPFMLMGVAEVRATLIAERVLLEAFKEWTRRLGLVAFKKTRIRNDVLPPSFGQYAWDFSAPSYVYPLRILGAQKTSPGFVVADVVLKDGLTAAQARYFFRKCNGVRSTPRMHPFLSILIAIRFEREVLEQGQEAGVILATPRNLFGENIETALREIVRTLSNAGAVAATNPDQIKSIFERLHGFEGAMQQLRGPLFELIVGHCVQRSEEGSVDVNRDVLAPSLGHQVNIDVLHVKGTQTVTAYECKGRLSEAIITKSQVEDWLTRQVPRIVDYIHFRNDLRGRRISVAFWTTGKLAPDAISYLQERRRITQRYTIEWRNGEEVRRYASDNHLSGVVKMLDDYYRSPPE